MKTILPNATHSQDISQIHTARSIQLLQVQLDEIFRKGIREPSEVPYVNQLLKQYNDLVGKEYKINKENTIV